MKLVHYSFQPIKMALKIPQGSDTFKPRGLWVSDDDCPDNWKSWCESEEFGLERLTHIHDVKLVPNANIKIISLPEELDDLSHRFKTADCREYFYSLDWASMRSFWDGLIITPYIWQRRLHGPATWYYSWDCASGCIWHPRAIESITLREIAKEPTPNEATESND